MPKNLPPSSDSEDLGRDSLGVPTASSHRLSTSTFRLYTEPQFIHRGSRLSVQQPGDMIPPIPPPRGGALVRRRVYVSHADDVLQNVVYNMSQNACGAMCHAAAASRGEEGQDTQV